MELNIVCTNIGEIPVLFVLPTGSRPIVLGGSSNILELWLWRIIFIGRNLCQSLQLKVDTYSLQLLINVSSFSFLMCYPIDSFFHFWRKRVIRETKWEVCKREICLPVSKEMRVRHSWRRSPSPKLLPDSQCLFLNFQREGGMRHLN